MGSRGQLHSASFSENCTNIVEYDADKREMRQKEGRMRTFDYSRLLEELLVPDISATTVERALADLVKSGAVEKVGGGRGTAYVRR